MKRAQWTVFVSPFQIQENIPSGGKIVSNFTHRLPFRVQEQLEKITRRKSVQKNQKISTSERTNPNDSHCCK
jgi:hypothetical protein